MTPKGVSHPGVLDAFAYDGRRDTLVLAMYETREWTGGEAQLFQLQEKLNAYASFILDGEMAESFPQYADRPVEIQLRTTHEPDGLALRLIASAREQLSLQEIRLEVILADGADDHVGGDGCGCGHGDCHA
ncbi:MAG: DUF6572 domain-containing protein [Verrucomicrobiota bacterium]